MSCSGDDFKFGTDDFTVDFWVYPTSFANEMGLYDARTFGADENGTYGFCLVCANNTGKLWVYYSNNGSPTSSSGLTLNQWNHVAMVRISGHTYIYIDGGLVLDFAHTQNISAGSMVLGRYANGADGYLNGYLDEVRVSKGIARWTDEFTPPTTEYGAIVKRLSSINFMGLIGV